MAVKNSEARKVYETYWESYFDGKIEAFAATIDDGFSCIGTPVNSQIFFEKPSSLVLLKLYQDNCEGTVRNIENAFGKISEIRSMTKTYLQ